MKKYDYVLDISSPIEYLDLINIATLDGNVLVRLQNTIGLTSSMLLYLDDSVDIRVAGGYDNKRVTINKNIIYDDGETGKYYYDCVIYSRDELIKILKEIEKIEDEIEIDFTDLEKVVYIYQKLKSTIMYSPNYLSEPSKKVRSLRGLLTKQTVCAGYALIFKELMDRCNIRCDYVEGISSLNEQKDSVHAWNILELDGHKYGVDLTFENSRYRKGNFDSFHFLCLNPNKFSQTHIPFDYEKIKDYKNQLHEMDRVKVTRAYLKNSKSKKHTCNIYSINKEDGSKSLICHEGKINVNNKTYNRYFIIDDISSNTPPIIVFTEFNLTHFIYSKINGGRKYSKDDVLKVARDLFSSKNINDSLSKDTLYIGNIYSSIDGVLKEESDINNLKKHIKIVKREDESYYILEPLINYSNSIYKYNIYELRCDDDIYYLDENMIYSNIDLICYDYSLTRDDIQWIIDSNRIFSVELFDGEKEYEKKLRRS